MKEESIVTIKKREYFNQSTSQLTRFCLRIGWLVLVGSFGHWITVTKEESPPVWLFQRKIYRPQQLLGQISRMFSSRQSILDRAGLPTVIQLGTIALMAHLGQRSSFSLLSGLDVSRLEPHRLGLSRIGRF